MLQTKTASPTRSAPTSCCPQMVRFADSVKTIITATATTATTTATTTTTNNAHQIRKQSSVPDNNMQQENHHDNDFSVGKRKDDGEIWVKSDFLKACNCLKSPEMIYHPFESKPTKIVERRQSQSPTKVIAGESEKSEKTIMNNNMEHTCRNYYVEKNLPYPPPLPEPKFSFFRRVLPQSLIQLSSPEGKVLFKESLLSQTAESFFPLSEQFLNQSDPAYCGVTSLIMILNAIGIDPNVRWKGGWRWYGSEDMILNGCCIDSERVRRAGISMEEYQSLGRCQGLQIQMKRPSPLLDDTEERNDEKDCDDNDDDNDDNVEEEHGEVFTSIEEFRNDIKHMTQNPPIYEPKDDNDNDGNSTTSAQVKGGFIVVSFSRRVLGQTGDGHFSPIAAYHESSDRCLILDVARFKYSPYWVSITDLYEAMKPVDKTTNKSRGWFMNHPPELNTTSREKKGGDNGVAVGLAYRGMKAIDEVKRPVAQVPLFDSGVACPVEKIKVKYCASGKP